MNVGMSWSLLSIGSGMLVGLRIDTSMVLGMVIAWVIGPPLLLEHGLVPHMVRREMLLWIMWPAVGCLVAGGLTALFLRWKVLVKSFRSLTAASVGGSDFPMRWVIWGSIASGLALVAVQLSLGMPIWLTLVAIVLTVPLMLVGIRVLGETNWGPISALTNMMQGIFGGLAPGSMVHNLTASGVTGSIASQSGRIDAGLQDRAPDRQHAASTSPTPSSSPCRWARRRWRSCIRCCATPTASAATTGCSHRSRSASPAWRASSLSRPERAAARCAAGARGGHRSGRGPHLVRGQRADPQVGPSPTGLGIGMLRCPAARCSRCSRAA